MRREWGFGGRLSLCRRLPAGGRGALRLLVLLLVTLAAGGCVARQVKVASPPPSPPPSPAPPPSPPAVECQAQPAPVPEVVTMRMVRLPERQFLGDRLAFYRNEVHRWQQIGEAAQVPGETAGCQEEAAALQDAYQALLALPGPYVEEGEVTVEPWQVAARDLAYQGRGCAAPPVPPPTPAPAEDTTTMADAAALAEDAVAAYLKAGRFQECVAAYGHLQELFPEWQVSPATRAAYGRCLARVGKARQAAAVFLALAGEAESSGLDRYTAMRLAGDLLLAAGDRAAARETYQRLQGATAPAVAAADWAGFHVQLLANGAVDDPALSLYQLFLWESFLFDGRHLSAKLETAMNQLQTFYGDRPLSQRAAGIYQELRRQVAANGDRLLERIAAALSERDYALAARLETEAAAMDLQEEQRDRLAALHRQRQAAEDEIRQRLAAAEAEQLAAAWQQADALFAAQRWDEAIAAYSGLAASDPSGRAQQQVVAAADQAAGTLRRRAATLFLQARRAADPDQRQDLLRQARQLLQTAVDRYPQTSLLDKIQANLAVVDKELAALSPPAPPPAAGDLR